MLYKFILYGTINNVVIKTVSFTFIYIPYINVYSILDKTLRNKFIILK